MLHVCWTIQGNHWPHLIHHIHRARHFCGRIACAIAYVVAQGVNAGCGRIHTACHIRCQFTIKTIIRTASGIREVISRTNCHARIPQQSDDGRNSVSHYYCACHRRRRITLIVGGIVDHRIGTRCFRVHRTGNCHGHRGIHVVGSGRSGVFVMGPCLVIHAAHSSENDHRTVLIDHMHGALDFSGRIAGAITHVVAQGIDAYRGCIHVAGHSRFQTALKTVIYTVAWINKRRINEYIHFS